MPGAGRDLTSPPPPCSTGSSFQGSPKGTGTASAEGPADAASLLSGTSWSQNAGLTSAGLSGRSRGATGVSRWERGQHRPEGRVTELGPGRPGVGSCPGLLRSCLPGLSFPSVAPGQASGSRPLRPPPHVCADPPHPPRSRGTPPSPEQDLVSATARVDATALSVSRRRGAGSGAGPSVYGTSLGSGQPDVRPSARHGEGPRPEPQPGPSGGSLVLPSGTHAHSTRTGADPSRAPTPAERCPQPSSVDVLQ